MSTQSQYGSLDSAGTQPDYSRVFTFNSNRSLQNIQDSATVNVSVDLTLNSNTTRSLATGDPMTASVVIPTVVNGENGVGANGLRIAEGYVYYSQAVAGGPSTVGTPEIQIQCILGQMELYQT